MSSRPVSDLPGRAAEAARELREVDSVLFVTGAGISVDSGLPTYRGIGGLYGDIDTEEGVPIEEALSGSMMERDPSITWKYIHQIEERCRGARHNRGHEIVTELCSRFSRGWVLTQNVDGFHADAGADDLIEIHGNLRRLVCIECDDSRSVANYEGLEIPPRCERCEGLIRPDVVLFGEMLPNEAIAQLRRELSAGFGAVVSIGTSAVFPYIAEPIVAAARIGVPTMEIDPGETHLSGLVKHRLQAPATEALEALLDAW